MEKQVVVRFAPSPTGYLHIGGARTAIFNWLYAQKYNGKFILRIEDTDAERSTKDSIQGIVDGLKWLGLDWDDGPNFQSNNIDHHLNAADRLVNTGHAYKCFCSKENIDQKRETAVKNKTTYMYDRTCRNLTPDQVKEKEHQETPFAIRLKIPKGDGAVRFTDAVYGDIEKKHADLDDFIIVRSNKKPLYILSNTVDDINDGVTHIIRGQDGLANTPKQILLYQALKTSVPIFAHMSLTLDPKKAKISKRRHGEMVAVHYYRQKGFLSWAFVNFLVLLGWATSDSKEIFSKHELVEAFALEGISKTNSVFNINQDDPKFFTDPKALNINAHYIKTLPVSELLNHVKPFLKTESLWSDTYENQDKEWFLNTIDLIRDRFHVLTDFSTKGRPYFSDEYPMDNKAVEKNILAHPDMKTWLPELAVKIKRMKTFNEKSLELILRGMLKDLGVKPGILINGIRVAVTGQSVGPDFMKSLVLLGQVRLVDRLANVPALFL